MKRTHAFTLIELLIVVAIIAILAAIAVPNFLQAQTRAKVSRVYADMRSLGNAIEEYAVDFNRPPLGVAELKIVVSSPPLPSNRDEINLLTLSTLTTPIAYITSLLKDPFVKQGARTNQGTVMTRIYYQYQAWSSLFAGLSGDPNEWRLECYKEGYAWGLQSFGPSGTGGGMFCGILLGYSENSAYDSSNGTTSRGRIIRTNKGIWAGPDEKRQK